MLISFVVTCSPKLLDLQHRSQLRPWRRQLRQQVGQSSEMVAAWSSICLIGCLHPDVGVTTDEKTSASNLGSNAAGSQAQPDLRDNVSPAFRKGLYGYTDDVLCRRLLGQMRPDFWFMPVTIA